MRALIVDDDAASRQVLRAHLSSVAETALAGDGGSAVLAVIDALARNEPYDVVFLDILMPGLDGHQTLEKIREAEDAARLAPEKRVKAIMVTSMDDEENHMTALFDGLAAAYIVKPVNKQELLTKLETLRLVS